MRNVVIAIVALVALGGGYLGFQYWGVTQEAIKWDGEVKEILSSKIEKEGEIAHIELTARIDAPVADVFEAFKRPERTQTLVEEIKRSKVVESTDGKKTVEFHMTILGQLQILVVDLTYDPAGNRIGIKTVEGSTHIDGAYALTPSPDGAKTLVRYTAKQENKLPLPVPANVERSAIKQQFASLMKAIRLDLAGAGGSASLADRHAA